MLCFIVIVLVFGDAWSASNVEGPPRSLDGICMLSHVRVQEGNLQSVGCWMEDKEEASAKPKWLFSNLFMSSRHNDSGVAGVEPDFHVQRSSRKSSKVQLTGRECLNLVPSDRGRRLFSKNMDRRKVEEEYCNMLVENEWALGCLVVSPPLCGEARGSWAINHRIYIRWDYCVELFSLLISNVCEKADTIVCFGPEGLAVVAAAAQKGRYAILRPKGKLYDDLGDPSYLKGAPGCPERAFVIMVHEFDMDEFTKIYEGLAHVRKKYKVREYDAGCTLKVCYGWDLAGKSTQCNKEKINKYFLQKGESVPFSVHSSTAFYGADKVFSPFQGSGLFTRVVPDISCLESKSGYIVLTLPRVTHPQDWYYAQAVLWNILTEKYPGKWHPVNLDPSDRLLRDREAYYVAVIPSDLHPVDAWADCAKSVLKSYTKNEDRCVVISQYVPYVSLRCDDGDFPIGGTARPVPCETSRDSLL